MFRDEFGAILAQRGEPNSKKSGFRDIKLQIFEAKGA